ncbi:uncharacterized protein VTP21DRAFT_11511 [Calcarisporiella thermophila]|uniref:uncharacterized protein n=1 Tax=Calcarisporiella thermophila TaxID=911321 RepID=UPI003743FF85
MSIGARKTAAPKKSNVFGTEDSKRKRKFGGAEGEEGQMELITGFEDNRLLSLNQKDDEGPLVIPKLPNRDWRAEAARRKGVRYIPEEISSTPPATVADTTETLNGIEAGKVYGLQILEKKDSIKVDNVTDDNRNGTTVENGETEKSPSQSEDQNGTMEVDTEESLEKRAIKELLSGANSDSAETSRSNLVIPNTLQDAQRAEYTAYKSDIETLPDEASIEDYENIPVEDFGLALLRGMGWKEGQAVGKNRKYGMVAPVEFQQRPALLGLGAKESKLVETVRASEYARRLTMNEKVSVKSTSTTSIDSRSSESKHQHRDRSREGRREKRSRSRSRSRDRLSRRDRERSRSRDRSSRKDRARSGSRDRTSRRDKERSRSRDRSSRKDRDRNRSRERSSKSRRSSHSRERSPRREKKRGRSRDR